MNTLLVMSYTCYLVTQNPNQMSAGMSLNLFISIVKLIIYFHFGENIFKSFNQLKKKLEELTLSKTLTNDDWKQLISIKDMKSQFTFSVMYTFKLRSETSITLGSFILQYAVILIQTSI